MSTSYKVGLDRPAVMTDPDQGSLMVRVWDVGPTKPHAPDKPATPEGKEGAPAYELAMVEFEGVLAKYKADLKSYGAALRDFEKWHQTYEGPFEMEMFSVDAREAMQIDPERYCVSDDRLPNHGLPKGRKPGRWHDENKHRMIEESRARAREMARDPVFGTQGASL